MKQSLLILLALIQLTGFSQNYIDTVFTIDSEFDISYGIALDFAGNERELLLDISYPSNDTIPLCGRPLMLIIHGGSFIAGSKDEGYIPTIREHFAKRGYVTAAINYRLGQFQTSSEINCNTSTLGLEWNCLNMADSLEWKRAYHRGIQDAHGAIRYLVNHSAEFDIDPMNIFLVGESAGGYIAMGTGFIDSDEETCTDAVGELADVSPPNTIYESACIQGYGLDTSIVSMNLSRPDLGPYDGELNFPANSEYKIQGVGNIYGGVFKNIFYSETEEPPSLYLFHQPNDLIVPFNHNKLLQGFSVCASGFPLYCQGIVNRPFTSGSNHINSMLESMELEEVIVPEYWFDPSSNTSDCGLQVLDPSLSGHAFDNFWLRTSNMATFFSDKMEFCLPDNQSEFSHQTKTYRVYPNPIKNGEVLNITGTFQDKTNIFIRDINGNIVQKEYAKRVGQKITLGLNDVSSGVYCIEIVNAGQSEVLRLMITD